MLKQRPSSWRLTGLRNLCNKIGISRGESTNRQMSEKRTGFRGVLIGGGFAIVAALIGSAATWYLTQSPPQILEFSAQPSDVARGEIAEIRWQVANSRDVEIHPGIGSVSAWGTRTVRVDDPTTFTLIARNMLDSTAKELRLRIAEAPEPATSPPLAFEVRHRTWQPENGTMRTFVTGFVAGKSIKGVSVRFESAGLVPARSVLPNFPDASIACVQREIAAFLLSDAGLPVAAADDLRVFSVETQIPSSDWRRPEYDVLVSEYTGDEHVFTQHQLEDLVGFSKSTPEHEQRVMQVFAECSADFNEYRGYRHSLMPPRNP